MSIAARSTSEIELPGKSGSTTASLTNRAGILLTGAVLVIAAIGLIYYASLAITWYNHPFLGLLTSNNLVVLGTRPLENGSWPGLEAGLKQYDRILRLESSTSLP